jgi:hydroxymethylglutaryl-CoA reductase
MNGIDAVCIATGNDWRAVEAGAHAYAARNGRYAGLTDWHVTKNGDLYGEMTLPSLWASWAGPPKFTPRPKWP